MSKFLVHEWHPEFAGVAGGIESFVREMIEFRSNQDVTFLNSNYSGEWNGINCVKIPLKVPGINLPNSLKFALGLSKYLAFEKPSGEFILHRLEYVLLVRLFAPRASIFLFLHTDAQLLTGKNSDSKWRFAPFIYKVIQSLALRFSTIVFVLNPRTFDYVSGLSGSLTIQIPGSFHPIFQLGSSVSDFKKTGVVWIGRLETVKNPILACKILNQLSETMPTLLIGRGSLADECKKVLRQEVSRIAECGSRQELASILATKKYLIMTSHFEGAPKVFLEALAAGCVVIATKESDTENHVDFLKNHIRIVPDEVEAFITAMSNLEQRGYIPLSQCELNYLANRSSSSVMRDIWARIELKS